MTHTNAYLFISIWKKSLMDGQSAYNLFTTLISSLKYDTRNVFKYQSLLRFDQNTFLKVRYIYWNYIFRLQN